MVIIFPPKFRLILPGIVLLFSACTVAESSCGVALPEYDGPTIVSTNETLYYGSAGWWSDLNLDQLRTDDSLYLNAAVLDSNYSVFTTYSANCQILRQDFHDFDPDTSKKEYAFYWVIFTYNEQDSLILETIMADSNKVLYSITHERDSRGNRIRKQESYKLSTIYEYQYNKRNQMIRSSAHAVLSYYETTYEYDPCGRLAKSIYSNDNYGIIETRFSYDEHNRCLKENITSVFRDFEDGSGGMDTSSHEIIYRYNEKGYLAEDADGTYYYNYDAFGNWIAKMYISNSSNIASVKLTVREINYAN